MIRSTLYVTEEEEMKAEHCDVPWSPSAGAFTDPLCTVLLEATEEKKAIFCLHFAVKLSAIMDGFHPFFSSYHILPTLHPIISQRSAAAYL